MNSLEPCLEITCNPFRTNVLYWQKVKPQIATVTLNLKITVLPKKGTDHILIFFIVFAHIHITNGVLTFA